MCCDEPSMKDMGLIGCSLTLRNKNVFSCSILEMIRLTSFSALYSVICGTSDPQ